MSPFDEILADLKAAMASLARIEHLLLTKPRASGERGHQSRYWQAASHVDHAKEAAKVAADLVVKARQQ